MITDVYSRMRRVGELAREQLRRAAQSAERIFDLVRELANHQPAAADLRQQRGLARDALMLGRVADLDQHRRRRAGFFVRRDGAIDDELAIAVDRAAAPARAARTAARSRIARSMTASSAAGIGEQLGERPAARLVAADAEQRFGGDVQIEERARAIDDQHAGAETVENASRDRPWRSRQRRIEGSAAIAIRHPHAMRVERERRLRTAGGRRDQLPCRALRRGLRRHDRHDWCADRSAGRPPFKAA